MTTGQVLTKKHSAKDLFPTDVRTFISSSNGRADFTVIDVSTPWEYAERHLEHAVNISFFSSSFKSRINRLEKDHAYLVYCKIGGRSKMAQTVMQKMGFEKVYNLVGGTLLWEEEGLPLVEEGKKSIFSFCPVTFFVKGVRKTRRYLGGATETSACGDLEASCRCDGSAKSRNGRWWQDCCR